MFDQNAVNRAQNKPATQSSIDAPASRAVNGDLNDFSHTYLENDKYHMSDVTFSCASISLL